jgi:uncharacterized protein (DUF2147 family)
MNRTVAGFLAAAALVLFPLSLFADTAGDSILGVWRTTEDTSKVLIARHGDKFFGQIISLRQPIWPATARPDLVGKPKRDGLNPDPALRKRLIPGIEIMSNLDYAGKNHWDGGKIYDPESGKTYHCKLTLVGTNRLEVRGYIGISLIGRTVVWTR